MPALQTQRRRRRHLQLAAGALALLLATAAHATRLSGETSDATVQPAADTSSHAGFPYLGHSILASRVILYSMSLLHAKYRFGGSDPSTGIDCSGFVRHVYLHTTGLDLPHNARAMSEEGARVNKKQLRPGDLVFFKTIRNAVSHVGIYIGNNLFIHAENHRKGVRISALNNHYWRRHFDGARRFLMQDLRLQGETADTNVAATVSARNSGFEME